MYFVLCHRFSYINTLISHPKPIHCPYEYYLYFTDECNSGIERTSDLSKIVHARAHTHTPHTHTHTQRVKKATLATWIQRPGFMADTVDTKMGVYI